MTAGDVVDEILGRYGGESMSEIDNCTAVQVLVVLFERLKGENGGREPITPDEAQRAKAILRCTLESFEVAEARGFQGPRVPAKA